MSFNCKESDGDSVNIDWLYVKNGWIPAVTVCAQNLYKVYINENVSISVPSVNTDALETGYQGNATINGNIISSGAVITEYGFVYSQSENPTISDSKIVVGTSNFIGEFEGVTGNWVLEVGPTYYFRAYATNQFGTGYGAVLSGVAYSCLAQGTLITLANGNRKPIENITFNDMLLVWNFDDCKYDYAKPIWIENPFTIPQYRLLKFENGSTLGVGVVNGHRIYNYDKEYFAHINEFETPYGTLTFTDYGESVKLIDSEIINEETKFYNIVSNKHINIFANGILTSSKLNNIYDIRDMKYVKDNRVLRTKEEFNCCDDLSNELFEGLRLSEQPTTYSGLVDKVKNMINQKRSRLIQAVNRLTLE